MWLWDQLFGSWVTPIGFWLLQTYSGWELWWKKTRKMIGWEPCARSYIGPHSFPASWAKAYPKRVMLLMSGEIETDEGDTNEDDFPCVFRDHSRTPPCALTVLKSTPGRLTEYRPTGYRFWSCRIHVANEDPVSVDLREPYNRMIEGEMLGRDYFVLHGMISSDMAYEGFTIINQKMRAVTVPKGSVLYLGSGDYEIRAE